jgi:hypothetical protein
VRLEGWRKKQKTRKVKVKRYTRTPEVRRIPFGVPPCVRCNGGR